MKSIGIDIGTFSIKIAEINSTARGFSITQVMQKELSQIPGHDNHLETIEFLRQTLSLYDAEHTRFVIALKQNKVTHRLKSFPFHDRSKILKSLPFELEEELPFDSENAIYEAKSIRYIGPITEVLTATVPRHHVEKAIELAKDSNFQPYVLSSEGAAISNLIEQWNEPIPTSSASDEPIDSGLASEYKDKRHVDIVLTIGHTETIVCAYEKQRLVSARTIFWGMKNAGEAIAIKYELPLLDALREIKNKGQFLVTKQNASFEQVTFSDTLAKSFRELTRDLQLVLLELQSELNATVDQIHLTGGGSLVKNLNAFITQNLEIATNRVRLLDQFSQVLFDKNDQIDATYGIAIGLALEGLKRPKNPALNFLKGDLAPQNDAFKEFFRTWGYPLTAASVLFFVALTYAHLKVSYSESLLEDVDAALTEQAKTVAKLPRKQQNENGINKFIKENKKRISDFKKVSNLTKMNSAVEVLKKVSEVAPARPTVNIDIHNFKVSEDTVSLEGYANSPREVSLLGKELEKVARDGKVDKKQPQLASQINRSSFSFEFKTDRNVSSARQSQNE